MGSGSSVGVGVNCKVGVGGAGVGVGVETETAGAGVGVGVKGISTEIWAGSLPVTGWDKLHPVKQKSKPPSMQAAIFGLRAITFIIPCVILARVLNRPKYNTERDHSQMNGVNCL